MNFSSKGRAGLLALLCILLFSSAPLSVGGGVPAPPHEGPVKLLFLGDVMFDRHVRMLADEYGYDFLFGDAKSHLESYDLVIANLEGPVTSHPSVSTGTAFGEPNHMRFTFSRDALSALREHHIHLVHLGNNHILDFGYAGLQQTLEALKQSGLRSFGDIKGQNMASAVVTLGGITLAFISYNEFLGEDIPSAVDRIEEADEYADFVFLYTHWGEEYKSVIPDYIEVHARRFIDAGADVVIGSHPHVVGESIVYEDGALYYSLGNFIFDQYWDSSVRCGAGLEVHITAGRVSTYLIPTSFSPHGVIFGSCPSAR